MTKDQIRTETERHLSEHYDGYVLVGRVAGRAEVIVLCDTQDLATQSAIATGLSEVLQGPDFKAVREL